MKLIDRYAAGTGNIDLKFDVDQIAPTPFVLVQLQVHFVRESGAAAEYTNPLVVQRYAAAGTRFCNELFRKVRAGVGSDDAPFDLNLRVQPDELHQYRFGRRDQVWLRWTDPSSAVVGWGLELSLALWDDETGAPI